MRAVEEVQRSNRRKTPTRQRYSEPDPEPQVLEPRRVAPARDNWVPGSNSASIHGRNIGGMVYVGSPPKYVEAENELIDPKLPVARVGNDLQGEGMGYWPSYSRIPSVSRATYLDWLASGRSDPDYNVGYMFLYFYGLERRFMGDQGDLVEKRAIVAEVERLLDVYGEHRSVRRYLDTFLDIAKVAVAEVGEIRPVYGRAGFDIPFTNRLGIGRLLAEGENISAEWMLAWLYSHPDRALRTAAKRAFPEFKELFIIRFQEKFPDGLKVKKPRRVLSATYQAASSQFTTTVEIENNQLPDISGLSSPLDKVAEIAEDATQELDKFSRYLGRNPDGRGTIEAHALLPAPLRPLFPCQELEELKTWVSERIAEGGFVPVADLIQRLEGARPDRLTKRQLIGAADALASLSIGMAPDPRYSMRSPKFEEAVYLFPLSSASDDLETISETYQSTLLAITLGSFIAHADGTVSELERRHLEDRIDTATDLSESERARLRGNLSWMMAVAPDLSLLRRRLKNADDEVRTELSRMALAVAGVDGHIDPAEVKAVEKLYAALDLDTNRIHSDLHSIQSSTEPVTVQRPTEVVKDFAIPAPPEDKPVAAAGTGIDLDPARIAEIMSNTQKVSGVLSQVFAVDDEEDPDEDESGDVGQETDDSRFDGLDGDHRNLLIELLSAETWSEEEFEKLAGRFGLMADGAMETINEWSFEKFDEELFESYDGITVNPEVAAQLAD